MVGGGGFTHLATYIPAFYLSLFYSSLPSLILSPSQRPKDGSSNGPKASHLVLIEWRRDEYVPVARSFKLRSFLFAMAILILALSTDLLKSCKYLYILYTCVIM